MVWINLGVAITHRLSCMHQVFQNSGPVFYNHDMVLVDTQNVVHIQLELSKCYDIRTGSKTYDPS